MVAGDGDVLRLLGAGTTAEHEHVERTLDLLDPHLDRTRLTVVLPAGSTVLLYTDGLVERRDQPFDDGVDLLGAALADVRRLPVAQVCDALLGRLLPERSMDDVALVAVRVREP